MTLLVLLQPLAQAQTPPVAVPKTAASAAKSVTAVTSKPNWAELTPLQQQSLKPLAAKWNGISEAQKRKWLEVSKSYPNLPASDQVVMHSRMNEWVALSPQQRRALLMDPALMVQLHERVWALPREQAQRWGRPGDTKPS